MRKYKFNLAYYIQLMEVFTVREIKSRYKASLLGPLWIIIYPLITTVILNIVFGYFIRIPTNGVPYFLLILTGLLFWNFFQQGLNTAKDALIWNRDLVTKSAFPKSILPLSYVLSKIPDYFVSLALLLFFYIFNGYKIDFPLFIELFLLVPLVLFTSGLSLIFSFANAIFRDFSRIVEFILLILFYTTPIVYPDAIIPVEYRILLYLNPLSLFIITSREAMFNHTIKIEIFLYSLGLSLIIFLAGFYFFSKNEKKMADLI